MSQATADILEVTEDRASDDPAVYLNIDPAALLEAV